MTRRPPSHLRRIARREAERHRAERIHGLPLSASKGKRQAAARELLGTATPAIPEK